MKDILGKMEVAMKKKMIIALVILLVIAAGIFYFLTRGNVGTNYNTAQVKIGKIEKIVEEIGTINSRNLRKHYGDSVKTIKKIDLELGDYVKKGQLLIKFEDNIDENINITKRKIAKVKSSIDFANENKDKLEILYKNGGISESELKKAKYELEQLQGDIDLLALSLQNLQVNKKDSMIFADFDGLITELNTFEGDTPSAGTMILEIMDPLEKNIIVNFKVADALLIKADMKAEVNDGELGIKIENIKVQKIHPKSFTTYSDLGVEENRQSIELSLPQSNQELPFGLKVKTKVMIEESKEALLIPVDAVYEKDLKNYVEVLEGGKTLEREVVTGIENNNYIEIKDGLIEGEEVILIYERSH